MNEIDFNVPFLNGFRSGINNENYKHFICLFTPFLKTRKNPADKILEAFFFVYRNSKNDEFSEPEKYIVLYMLKIESVYLKIESIIENDINAKIPTIDDPKRKAQIIELMKFIKTQQKIVDF